MVNALESNTNRYRLSFVSGGLFLRESTQALTIYRTRKSWTEVRQGLIDEKVVSYNTLSSATRISRELVLRLSSLHGNEIEFYTSADFDERRALIWVAVCRTYQIIPEFVSSVLTERILSHRNDLLPQDFSSFLAQRALDHEEVFELADSTRVKLRTVLYRMLQEAGFYTRTSGLQRAYLPMTVRRLLELRRPSEILFFPGHGT